MRDGIYVVEADIPPFTVACTCMMCYARVIVFDVQYCVLVHYASRSICGQGHFNLAIPSSATLLRSSYA
jgi:hypothetical protein